MAERVGFELEVFCGRLSPQPKSRCNRDHCKHGGEGGIRTHGTVSRTLAFEASTFNRSVTSPRSVTLFYQTGCCRGYGVLRLGCMDNYKVRELDSPAGGEEHLQQGTGLFREHTRGDFDLMIQLGTV